MIEKAESRRIRVQIRRVLLKTWDPVGVGDNPNAQDEYDGYIGKIYELLVADGPDSDLIDFLFWVAHENIGLDTTRENMLPTLIELKLINLSPSDDAQGSRE
jgi:hypothetical protein